MTKDKELKEALTKFVDAFEEVFDRDWPYTIEQLQIQDYISQTGTFLNPKVADETEDWGNRSNLLAEYRKMKKLLADG